MPTTYILLDFENVQPEDLAPLKGRPCQLRVFLGSQQTRLPRKLVTQLQQLADNAAYVEIEGCGPNALDFHIAYYMGKLAAEDPGSAFQVISRDTGFDVLIEHMKKQGVSCARFESLAALPRPSAAAMMSFDEKLSVVVDFLTRMKAAKPRSLKTLGSTISKKLDAGLPDTELEQLIQALHATHFLVVEKARVRYASDAEPVKPSAPAPNTVSPA
jgi:hypothetical protein